MQLNELITLVWDFAEENTLIISAIGLIFLVWIAAIVEGCKIVPHQYVWVIERLGKYNRQLSPGFHFILPGLERVAGKYCLKEEVINIDPQSAITKDNVTLTIDGVIYIRIIDAIKSLYGVDDYRTAVIQLAKTTMRSAIGKISLDSAFEAREALNNNILDVVNDASKPWGVECKRCEIKDIKVPDNVKRAMELEVAAERQKRADILSSEGKRLSMQNLAEARKIEVILDSEADMQKKSNLAHGEADAIKLVAMASAEGIKRIAEAIQLSGGAEAVGLKIAERYVDAFKSMSESSNTIVIPANTADISGMVTQILGVWNQVKNNLVQPVEAEKLSSSTIKRKKKTE